MCRTLMTFAPHRPSVVSALVLATVAAACGGAKPPPPAAVPAPAGTDILKAPASQCVIEADAGKDDTLSYVGNLWVDGSPVAHTSELGAVEKVKLSLTEKDPLGFIDITTDKFVLHMYYPMAMPTYYGKTLVVRDKWLRYDALTIAAPSAVLGADIAPHTELHDWVVAEPTRFGEADGFHVPCSNVTPFAHPPAADLAPDGTEPQPALLIAKPPIVLSDDAGKPVASLAVPADKNAPERAVLLLQKKAHQVLIRFDAGRALRAQGWVAASAVKLGGGTIGLGNRTNSVHREIKYTYLKCMQDAPIWVTTVDGTRAIGHLRAERPVRGVLNTDTGDFRMDLGADDQWSPTPPAGKAPRKGSPADPYIPKNGQTGICGEVAPPAGR